MYSGDTVTWLATKISYTHGQLHQIGQLMTIMFLTTQLQGMYPALRRDQHKWSRYLILF